MLRYVIHYEHETIFHYQGSFWILVSFYLLVARSATFIVYCQGFAWFLIFGGGVGNSAHITRLMKHLALSLVGTIPDTDVSHLMETIPGTYGSLHREFSVHGLCSGANFVLPLVESIHVTNGAFTKVKLFTSCKYFVLFLKWGQFISTELFWSNMSEKLYLLTASLCLRKRGRRKTGSME